MRQRATLSHTECASTAAAAGMRDTLLQPAMWAGAAWGFWWY